MIHFHAAHTNASVAYPYGPPASITTRLTEAEAEHWLGRRLHFAGDVGEVVAACHYEHEMPEDGWFMLVAWRDATGMRYYSVLDRAALAACAAVKFRG